MKEVIVLQDFENPEVNEMSDIIKEFKSLEHSKKELEVRMKILKEEIIKRLSETGNKFSDGKYEAVLKEFESKRLNTDKIKKLLEKNNISIDKFQTTVKSERLNINICK